MAQLILINLGIIIPFIIMCAFALKITLDDLPLHIFVCCCIAVISFLFGIIGLLFIAVMIVIEFLIIHKNRVTAAELAN